jgi:hypothetical protein
MQIRGSLLTVPLMREDPEGHWDGAKQIVEERLTKRLTPSANYVAVAIVFHRLKGGCVFLTLDS